MFKNMPDPEIAKALTDLVISTDKEEMNEVIRKNFFLQIAGYQFVDNEEENMEVVQSK